MSSIIKVSLVAASVVLAVASSAADAQVNWKNGNFYVTYTDVELDGLEISRTYNSKTVTSSIFGYGWGWVFATQLVPIGDGGMIVRYWGGGATSFFPAAFPSEPMIGHAVRMIVSGRVAAGWQADPEDAAAFRSNLRENLELRSTWWQRLADSGAVAVPRHPLGTRWESPNGGEKLTRVPEGYDLDRGDGDTMRFDETGRLIGMAEPGRGYVVAYDQRGHIASIRTTEGAEAKFTINDRGLVTRVAGAVDGKVLQEAIYIPDDRGDLREVKDAQGNRYRYTLDDLHNLRRIDYDDGTVRSITYDPVSSYATRVTNRDGSWTDYEYYGDDDLYGTRVIVRDSTRVTKRSRAEWEIRTAEDGRRFTWRYLYEEGDTLTETTYSECCGRAIRVRKKDKSGETITHYDEQGNVIKGL